MMYQEQLFLASYSNLGSSGSSRNGNLSANNSGKPKGTENIWQTSPYENLSKLIQFPKTMLNAILLYIIIY